MLPLLLRLPIAAALLLLPLWWIAVWAPGVALAMGRAILGAFLVPVQYQYPGLCLACGIVLITRIATCAETAAQLLLRLYASAMRHVSVRWAAALPGVGGTAVRAVLAVAACPALWLWRLALSSNRLTFDEEAVHKCSARRTREAVCVLLVGCLVLPAVLGLLTLLMVYATPVTVVEVVTPWWWVEVRHPAPVLHWAAARRLCS